MRLKGVSNTLGIAFRHQTWYSPARNNVSFYTKDAGFFDYVNSFPSGGNYNLTINWNPSTQTLSYDYSGIVRSYKVTDMDKVFGGTEVIIGFTGVIGDGTNTHVLYNPTLTVNTGREPIIDASDKTINAGENFSPLDGVSATDVEDGDITNKIKVIDNNVDTSKGGSYNVTYSVTDGNGNTTTKTIQVNVRPKMPVVQSMKDGDTTVTITNTSPGAMVSMILPDGTILNKVAGATGEVIFTTPSLVAGEKISAYQTEGGQGSYNYERKVEITKPTIPEIKESDKSVTVSGRPGATITLTFPDGTETSKAADSNGNATFVLNDIKEGDIINATQSKNGQVSSVSTVTVGKTEITDREPIINASDKTINAGENFSLLDGVSATDVEDGDITNKIKVIDNNVDTSKGGSYNVTYSVTDGNGNTTTKTIQVNVRPKMPVVQSMKDGDTTVTITNTSPGAMVSMILPDGTILNKVAGATGEVIFTTPSLVAGEKIRAYQTEGGQGSYNYERKVEITKPTIPEIKESDKSVTVSGRPGATITLTFPDGTETSKAADSNGNATFVLNDIKEGDIINATQSKNGQVSSVSTVTVGKTEITEGTITANDYTIGKDRYVKGALTGDVVKAQLEVNGKKFTTINVSGSTYQYYAKNNITKPTDQVYIIGYDATGKVLQRTKVNVKAESVTTGTITPNAYVLGTDTYVKGTFTGDVAKVSITVNGVVKQTINTPTSPFQYYAKDKILNLTDVVTVTAYDATGKVLDTKPVTVTKNNGQAGNVIADRYKLGKDSYVTGSYTGDVAKVSLEVNGTELQKIKVTGGTVKYYAKPQINSTTDVVKLNAYNSAGVLVSSKTVLISATEGTVTANEFVLGTDAYVKGVATGDIAKVALKVNGVVKSAIPATAGSYQYYAKTLITSETDVVEVVAYDAIGEVLNTATVQVSKPATNETKGTVTPQAFKIGTHSYVDGTYTGDVSKVELEVNGVKYSPIPANGNVIRYYAAGLIKDGTDDVKVNVYDAAGKLLDSKPVTINVATGTVAANGVKVGDSYLTGTATGDVYKVTLKVNGTNQASVAFVQPDGTYKYYIKALNLQPTDVVEVIGLDGSGRQINTTPVTITQ
ncbi:immunoglobulin-like domain-containing protein [Listeria booriae]|uniref:immunoglobulin-like domain-containing protein n=1 Tax=Listeria booriae TaxID=1552123 RepID=UPI0021AB8B7E|nr:immunoglobulin-like domain-containing protein [Listeria booriae]